MSDDYQWLDSIGICHKCRKNKQAKRPMNKSFNTAVLESKRRIPESARKHMDHKPYGKRPKGGRTGE